MSKTMLISIKFNSTTIVFVSAGQNNGRGSEPLTPDDQPCDLRLLTPATCLRELSLTATGTGNGGGSLHQVPFLIKGNLSIPPSTTSASSGGSGGSSTLSQTTIGGSYSCSRCGNSYARPHSLNRHIRFECGVEPKFECPVCHKKSKHKHNLVLHMRTHQHR